MFPFLDSFFSRSVPPVLLHSVLQQDASCREPEQSVFKRELGHMVRKQGGVVKALPPATTFDGDVYTSYIIQCHCLPTIAQRHSRGTGRLIQKMNVNEKARCVLHALTNRSSCSCPSVLLSIQVHC